MECSNIAKTIVADLGESSSVPKKTIDEFKAAYEDNVKMFNSLIESLYDEVPGLDSLHDYLKRSSFYEDPASYKYHNAFFGGLLDHSLNVYTVLSDRLSRYGIEESVPRRTIILVPLLHDVCKIGSYLVGYNWRKTPKGKWENYPGYRFHTDQFPAGHGEKSVFIISEYIKLTRLEMLAIRWHGGSFEDSSGYAFQNAAKYNDFVPLTHTADLEASFICESQGTVECLVKV